jgi:hypothetical protein
MVICTIIVFLQILSESYLVAIFLMLNSIKAKSEK